MDVRLVASKGFICEGSKLYFFHTVPYSYRLTKGITPFADGFIKAQEELVVYCQLEKVLRIAEFPPFILSVGSKYS